MSRYQELIGELHDVVKNSPGLPPKDAATITESANSMRSMYDIVKDIVYESPDGALCLVGDVVEIVKKNKQSELSNSNDFILYTDGACKGNPGPGGWGFIIVDANNGDEVMSSSGGVKDTTNNRMEMMAVIEGLQLIPELANVKVVSDSQYVINSLSQGWKRNKNHDLWEILDRLTKTHVMEYEWVKGHAGNEYNSRCDALAVEAAKFI